MPKRDLSALFGMEPKEAVTYLQKKKIKTSWDYREVWGEAHHRTFTVAKIMKADLLRDIHDSLTLALKDGTPFNEWHKRLKPTLVAKGWYGRTEVFNPDTGEFQTITVGSRRLKTIYETNMRSVYNYGRYQHLQRSGMPYWMYISALLPTTRDPHRAMHGAVYPKEHPFWSANYPPNGYNCKCKVRGYTEQMLKQRGIRPREEYETIADPGFTHSPATASLSGVWEEKILNAPDQVKDLARIEKDVSDMYDVAFESDIDLKKAFMAHKPKMIIDPDARISGAGAYSTKMRAIIFKSAPDLTLLRHESTHAIDHALGFISSALLPELKKDVTSWKGKREKIKGALTSKTYDDDFYIHDLFYLSSGGWVGYETRENGYMTALHQHAEAFAIMMEAYLSGTKLDIIKAYFPNSYKAFLELIAKIKEQ